MTGGLREDGLWTLFQVLGTQAPLVAPAATAGAGLGGHQ